MFKLDNDFLVSMGLGSLPVDEKNRLLQVIYERLEMNVGMRLAEKMTDQQLNEFEGFIDRNDEAGALRWLETNFPNYKDVVAEELEKLKKEVSASAPQILAAAQSAPVAPSQGQAINNQPVPTAPNTMANQPAPGAFPPQQPMQAPQPAPAFSPQSPVPGQQAPEPGAYNPENPFQNRNPETENSVSQGNVPGMPQTQQPPQPPYSPQVQPGFSAPAQSSAGQHQPSSLFNPAQPPVPPVQPAPGGFNPMPQPQQPQPPINPSQQPPAGFPPQQ